MQMRQDAIAFHMQDTLLLYVCNNYISCRMGNS